MKFLQIYIYIKAVHFAEKKRHMLAEKNENSLYKYCFCDHECEYTYPDSVTVCTYFDLGFISFLFALMLPFVTQCDMLKLLYEPCHVKTGFCICENKDPDQLHINRKTDQRLCFRYTNSTIPLPPKSEISSI